LTIFWIDFRRFDHFWLLNSNFGPPPAMIQLTFWLNISYLCQATNAAASSFWAQFQPQPQPIDECSSQLLFGLDSSLSPSMNAAASFFLGSIPAASARR
jgi:hypothetical protein